MSDESNMDKQLQLKLQELGRAVFEAIAESPDVSEALDLIRAEGYSLSMQLNCKKETSEDEALVDSIEALATRPLPAVPDTDPSFGIDGQDLTFLRSIGIDPTQRMRRRR